MEDKKDLDELDYAIINHLQKDGRKSFKDLATALDVSLGTIRNRYAKMKDSGVIHILGYAIPDKVGFQANAQLRISIRPSNRIKQIAEALMQLPECGFLAMTSGEYELCMEVLCPNNDHLTRMVQERIYTIEGVYHVNITMYLKLYTLNQPTVNLINGSKK